MRDASVFLCPPWEERFDMPGWEAMTWGAALATPDMKGSCDDAIHGRSARVVPPRESDQLAQAIILLPRAPEEREELVNGPLEVADGYPTWPESAGWFEKCLVRVVSQGINAL